MRTILVMCILVVALAGQAAAPPRGAARLRELAVFPKMNLGFHSGFKFGNYQCVVEEDTDSSDQISQLQVELKRQPDDIDRLLRLGRMLGDDGQTNESQSCYQKAEKLCENKVAENSRNGFYLINLGAAQGGLNRDVEAEITFRKAVLVSSNQWQSWTSLGNFLVSQSSTFLFPENLRRQAVPSGQAPSAAILGCRPSADALKKSMAYCHEASVCFDRAMSLAPTEPQVYLQRAGYISMSNWQSCFYQYFRDNQAITSQQWLSAYVSDEMVASLQKAADFSPKDYQLIGMAAYFKYTKAVALSPSQANVAPLTLRALPGPARQVVEQAMTHLEDLSRDPDKRTAAGASEYLGLLNMVFGNQPAAAENCRRAVTLDPSLNGAWDMLLANLLNSAPGDELASLCESRLKYQDSARNHLLLAKMYAQKAHKFKEAADQARIAATLETNNIVTPLILAAIALKDSVDTNALVNAYTELTRASALISRSPPNDDSGERWRECLLDQAILEGLVGTSEDQNDARDLIDKVLRQYPDDPDAMNIREALVN